MFYEQSVSFSATLVIKKNSAIKNLYALSLNLIRICSRHVPTKSLEPFEWIKKSDGVWYVYQRTVLYKGRSDGPLLMQIIKAALLDAGNSGLSFQ